MKEFGADNGGGQRRGGGGRGGDAEMAMYMAHRAHELGMKAKDPVL